MFTLKSGPLDQYNGEFIKLLSEVDESKYILEAHATHAYEDLSYNDIADKEELATKLSADLEKLGKNVYIHKVLDLISPEGHYPYVIVRNTKPMTVKQFILTIDEIYCDLGFDYILSNRLQSFDIVGEA